MECLSAQEKEAGFSQKYARYGKLLYQIALVQLGNKEDAEEAMQETFYKLLHKAPVFADSEHEKAWLIRVAVNICRDIRRKPWRKGMLRIEDVEPGYEDKHDADILKELVALPQKYKTVIHLHYVEDMPVRQIAQMLALSESAVKMRLLRGRELLKLELEGE